MKDFEVRKLIIMQKLRGILSEESLVKAGSDYHAKKPPRPCGMTVHSVVGCEHSCIYCYIPDMGFNFSRAEPYGLTSLEITYSLLNNPYFLPGETGTYIAMGSVGEPLHMEYYTRTVEYMRSFAKYLGNPIQLSTKSGPEAAVLEALSTLRGYPFNPLVTVITLKEYKRLEPNAPPPEERFELIRALRRKGLYPVLFLKPIIPGVNEDECADILTEARRAGASGVVIGGFRVTPAILSRLVRAGYRVPVEGAALRPGVQVPLDLSGIRKRVVDMARDVGLTPFLSACCALTYTFYMVKGHRIPCANLCYTKGICTGCPVDCRGIRVEVDSEDVRQAVARYLGIKVSGIEVGDHTILISTDNYRRARNRMKLKRHYVVMLETAYRKRLVLRG